MTRSDHGWEYDGIRFRRQEATSPSDWCRAMYEKTLDPAYITLYNMWKEREDAKVRRNGRDS